MSTDTVEREPAAAIDPRIAARRQQVERDHGRRRTRRLVVALGVIAAVAAAWGLTRTALLDIDRVEVDGLGQITRDEVLEASQLRLGDQLLDVDAAAVRGRLLALPFVRDASVRVDWPDAVAIAISERQPVAVITAADGRPLLVDAEGWVLGPASEPGGLVAIEGLEVVEPGRPLAPPAADVLAVVTRLTPGLRTRVEAVVSMGDTIDLRVRPAGAVWLGPATDLDAKLTSLTTVFAQVDDRDIATIDVRVADQPVLTRVPPRTDAESDADGG